LLIIYAVMFAFCTKACTQPRVPIYTSIYANF